MIDNDMTNILKNFASAGQENPTITDAKTGEIKQSTAAAEKNAMKAILEGLDAQQKSVNQMPATHKMAKATKDKHPAHKHFVGASAENAPQAGAEQLDEVEVEDPMADNDEYQALAMRYNTGDKSVLDQMAAMRRAAIDKQFPTPYDEVEEQLSPKPAVTQAKALPKKQSLMDILSTMEETEEQQAARFQKELHDEIQNKELKKGDNGKYSLAEAKPDVNFTADDLAALGRVTDLGKIKSLAIELISKPSKKPMKPEKVEWFKNSIMQKNSVASIIKMMWDLFLSGEGQGVVGSRYSTKKNSYRTTFGEDLTEDNVGDAITELEAQIKNLAFFAQSRKAIAEEFTTNNGDTFLVLARKIVEAVKDIRNAM